MEWPLVHIAAMDENTEHQHLQIGGKSIREHVAHNGMSKVCEEVIWIGWSLLNKHAALRRVLWKLTPGS